MFIPFNIFLFFFTLCSKEEIAAEVRVHVEAEKKAHYNVERLVLTDKVTEDELNTIVRIDKGICLFYNFRLNSVYIIFFKVLSQ